MTAIKPAKHTNNFDIVRLVLAAIVVVRHSYDLSGQQALRPLHTLASGAVAVQGFFAISGFLIFASYDRTRTLKEFAINRALRILPGYWVATALCLLIAFAGGHFHVGKFLAANLTFCNWLAPSIPGVFEHNPMTPMNGVLWTIKLELMFYVSVPIIAWFCRKWNRDAVLWGVFFLSIAFHYAFAAHEKLSIQYPGQAAFFMIGALTHYHIHSIRRHAAAFVATGVVTYILSALTGWFLFRTISVPVLVLSAALLLPHIQGPTRWGDFSYGMYVLQWPILQLVVSTGFFAAHPWTAFVCTFFLVAAAAACSWFFVEKTSLARSPSKRMRREALQDSPQYPVAVP